MWPKTASRASARVRQDERPMSSVSSDAKKLSAMALSQQSPVLPMPWAVPASRHRRPEAGLVHWVPLSE